MQKGDLGHLSGAHTLSNLKKNVSPILGRRKWKGPQALRIIDAGIADALFNGCVSRFFFHVFSPN